MWVQIPLWAQSFLFKAFAFSPSDTFWDKVKKIRKFCQQEKLTQYWQKLNEIAKKERYFAADTAKNILKIVIFFNRVQNTFVSYRLLIQYYNAVFNTSLSPESIARIVRYLIKHGLLFKIKERPASFFAELPSGTQAEQEVIW